LSLIDKELVINKWTQEQVSVGHKTVTNKSWDEKAVKSKQKRDLGEKLYRKKNQGAEKEKKLRKNEGKRHITNIA
jgi:hypothetical protein